ncbi:MAG TPA: YihY/virulence factor BrkB family protein [Candidatus Kapabacteria bacterium]
MIINLSKRFVDAVKYYALGLWNGLDDDHCFLFASGIAYNVILCIIPLSLILFQTLTFVFRDNIDAQYVVLRYIRQSLPVEGYGSSMEQWVSSQFSHVIDLALIPAMIALVILLWLSSALFSSLRTSLNAIFHYKPKQNMAVLKLLDIGMIFLFMIVLLFTLVLVPLVGALREFGDKFFPQVASEFFNSTLAYIVPICMMVMIFFILFKTLPAQRISWKVALLSTLITVGLLEVMRFLFVLYLQTISGIGAVYGAYAFLVAVALWAYYGGLVFLIGAEVGKLYRDRKDMLARAIDADVTAA